MGNQQSFADIEKKYGQKGVDYVIAKHQERKIYERINDQISRLNQNANLQERDDLEFIDQQKRRLDHALQQGKTQIQAKRAGSIKEAETRHKMRVEQFSGHKEKRAWLQNLEKQVRNKYATQKVKMEQRVRDQVHKHKTANSSLNRIPEYDRHPDNYRRSIENECLRRHASKQVDASDLQRKLTWDNYKQNFVTILNRDQVKKQVDNACDQIKTNVTGTKAPICC